MTVSRRMVLTGTVAAAAGLVVGGCSSSDERPPQQTDVLAHPPRNHAIVGAFDLDASRPAEALRTLAARAEDAPLGTQLTVGLGASLFDRAGIADRRPRQLAAMPPFPGDVLDPARTHGDVLLEVGADSAAAAKRIFREVAGDLRVRWQMAGFRDGTGVQGGRPLATNLFGFTEGHGNPQSRDIDGIVRVAAGQGEPAWATGGTYQVVRIIKFATALWDKHPITEQEQIIGRRRDGRWLDGTAPSGEPKFGADPRGELTPLESHVRLANPRTGPPPPMLRRGYSFQGGMAGTGRAEAGLLFIAYQRDLEEGFAAVQRRLAGERLGRYVLTVGGGYFFVPPPARRRSWWGAGLFHA